MSTTCVALWKGRLRLESNRAHGTQGLKLVDMRCTSHGRADVAIHKPLVESQLKVEGSDDVSFGHKVVTVGFFYIHHNSEKKEQA